MPVGLNVLLPRLFLPLLILFLCEFKLKDGVAGGWWWVGVGWGKEEGGKREERC